jgi:hypothetical protein
MTLYRPADVGVAVLARPLEPRPDQTLAALAAQTVTGFSTVVVDGPYGGEGAAANAARRVTDRPVLLFLSGDGIPAPNLVEAHLAFHDQHRGEGAAAAGRIVARPTVPAAGRWLIEATTRIGLDLRHASIPTSLIDTLGGFDDSFAFGLAGADLGRRIAAAGCQVLPVLSPCIEVDGPGDWAAVAEALDPLAWAERRLAAKHPDYAPTLEALIERSRRTRKLMPRFRESWAAGRELDELRSYLGAKFDWNKLFRHAQLVDHEHDEMGDEETFFRTSTSYLYDLTVFAMSRTKAPYLAALRELASPGAKVLDYGCGIGSDGLQLLDDGYLVSFADFDNPSTRYLKRRLDHRCIDAPVHDLDGDVPGGFDLAYAFDVIEHVDDPFALLAELEQRAGVVMVNLLETDPGDTHLHRELPIADLLAHARGRGLLYHRVHHRRSYLVAYRASQLPS